MSGECHPRCHCEPLEKAWQSKKIHSTTRTSCVPLGMTEWGDTRSRGMTEKKKGSQKVSKNFLGKRRSRHHACAVACTQGRRNSGVLRRRHTDRGSNATEWSVSIQNDDARQTNRYTRFAAYAAHFGMTEWGDTRSLRYDRVGGHALARYDRVGGTPFRLV